MEYLLKNNVNFLLKKGNIILEEADFIVNASNTELLLDSGVSGAFKEHCGGEKFQDYLLHIKNSINEFKQGSVILSDSGTAHNFRYSLHASIMNYSNNSSNINPTYEHIKEVLEHILKIVNGKKIIYNSILGENNVK